MTYEEILDRAKELFADNVAMHLVGDEERSRIWGALDQGVRNYWLKRAIDDSAAPHPR